MMDNLSDADDLTQLLQSAIDGDREAESQLCRIVYDELHRQASRIAPQRTLHATTIVQEVYLKLLRRQGLKGTESTSISSLLRSIRCVSCSSTNTENETA